MTPRFRLFCLGLCLAGPLGCGKRSVEPMPAGSLVVTQVPISATTTSSAGDFLDGRYPSGSRLVLAAPPLDPRSVRVLSEGLQAAGEPFVTPDNGRVLFSGKKDRAGTWQVYEATAGGGSPRALTAMEGGAMSPTLLADGSVVFVSPVPGMRGDGSKTPAALWALGPADKAPRRLTFGSAPAVDPTVLLDGRILFASAQPNSSPPRTSLFTIYNDGTGVSPYACQHDGTGDVARPRELADGRVAFVSRPGRNPGSAGDLEVVSPARPWRTRERLLADVPPAGGSGAATLHDPAWNEVEAVRVEPRKRPMGRISTIDMSKKTGVVFCIDVNHTTYEPATPAVRIRVLTSAGGGAVRPLGEVPVHEDGSFMAEVPADVPLGFEALDVEGKVVRRLPPSVWVRPGENRGCIGCHEPHGLAPRNRRPLAVKEAPVPMATTLAPGAAQGGAR